MPILTKEVEVKVNGVTADYYKSLGYDIPMKKASKTYYSKTGKEFVCDIGKTITVKVEDLPKRSDVCISVLCDMCKEKEMVVRYADYNKSIDKTGNYVCRDCSYLKAEQTKITRYGDVYFKTDEFKEKRKNTLIDKYGVESPLQNEEIVEKIRKTNLQKYGYENVSQVPEIREKIKQTNIIRFGVETPSKNSEVKEKIYNTNLQKYGAPYTLQVTEVRVKANETLCKNGTHKTSKQQLYLHSLYGGELNYPVSYYATDICFPEEKIVLEYDGKGHELRVVLGRLTQEEFDQKELIRDRVIKSEGYKIIRIKSNTDKLPSDQTLLQMLQEAKEYFSKTDHSWCCYDIDQSLLFNAEHKSGIHYSYGALRTIKETDLNTDYIAQEHPAQAV